MTESSEDDHLLAFDFFRFPEAVSPRRAVPVEATVLRMACLMAFRVPLTAVPFTPRVGTRTLNAPPASN